jgi:CheY-like chemotaxis protein
MKVMVVDDERAHSELIADFCQGAGFDVQTLNDSSKAVEKAATFQPDLITLDLEMPEMDGVEVLHRLRENPTTKGIPVVIISVAARGAQEKGLLEGVRRVFEKPVQFQKLVKDMEEIAISK